MMPLILALLAQNPATSPYVEQPVQLYDEGVKLGRVTRINCSGSGVTCTRTGATGTMTITGGAGGGPGGGAPVDAGYVYWGTNTTGSTNERKLAAGNYTTIDTGTAGEVQVDWAHGLTCSAGQAMTSSGTSALVCTSTLTASDVQCAGTCIADAEIVGIGGGKVSGAVATASALAADPADCSANQYANAISTTGALTCAQVAYSQLSGTPTIPPDVSGASFWTRVSEASLSNETSMGALGTGLVLNATTTGVPSIYGGTSCTNQFARSLNASGAATCAGIGVADFTANQGTTTQVLHGNAAGQPSWGVVTTSDLPTVPISKGGTNLTTIAANQVWTGTAADTVAAKTVPSCSNATTSKLLYDNATQTWSCGTDQTSAGGGYATIEDEGGALTQRTTLNFAGAGVSCADDTTKTTCTIAGGSGGGVSPLTLVLGTP